MAEIANRQKLEEQFAEKFGEIGRRHGREFAELLGDPPDLKNVPETFWLMIEREAADEAAALFLLIFWNSAEYHGWTGQESHYAAVGWAQTQAAKFGEYWSASVLPMFQSAIDRIWRRRQAATETETQPERRETGGPRRQTVDTHREQNRIWTPPDRIITPGDVELTDDELDQIIDNIFGPNRIARQAAIETTRARSAGAEIAVEMTFGLHEQDIYVNPVDDATCEICLPLAGTTRSVWIVAAPQGPPPLASVCCCRCYINYYADRIRDGVDHLFVGWNEADRRRYWANPELYRQNPALHPRNRT